MQNRRVVGGWVYVKTFKNIHINLNSRKKRELVDIVGSCGSATIFLWLLIVHQKSTAMPNLNAATLFGRVPKLVKKFA